MVTWNNKLVTVLSDANVIKFTNSNDFEEYKSLMKTIGLDFSRFTFNKLLEDCKYDARRHNRSYRLGNAILVGYSNSNGFQCGMSSEVAAEEWYGLTPFTWAEIKDEIKNI